MAHLTETVRNLMPVDFDMAAPLYPRARSSSPFALSSAASLGLKSNQSIQSPSEAGTCLTSLSSEAPPSYRSTPRKGEQSTMAVEKMPSSDRRCHGETGWWCCGQGERVGQVVSQLGRAKLGGGWWWDHENEGSQRGKVESIDDMIQDNDIDAIGEVDFDANDDDAVMEDVEGEVELNGGSVSSDGHPNHIETSLPSPVSGSSPTPRQTDSQPHQLNNTMGTSDDALHDFMSEDIQKHQNILSWIDGLPAADGLPDQDRQGLKRRLAGHDKGEGETTQRGPAKRARRPDS
ncbi:MAG: hypothetical protein Q9227_004610 [Pyrenula ochraceoflavens]